MRVQNLFVFNNNSNNTNNESCSNKNLEVLKTDHAKHMKNSTVSTLQSPQGSPNTRHIVSKSNYSNTIKKIEPSLVKQTANKNPMVTKSTQVKNRTTSIPRVANTKKIDQSNIINKHQLQQLNQWFPPQQITQKPEIQQKLAQQYKPPRTIRTDSFTMTASSSSDVKSQNSYDSSESVSKNLRKFVNSISDDSIITPVDNDHRRESRFRFDTEKSSQSSSDEEFDLDDDESDKDSSIRLSFYEIIDRREKTIFRHLEKLDFSMKHLPIASQIVLKSISDSISSILEIEQSALPKLEEIEDCLRRLHLCVLPFVAESAKGIVKTPRICSFGGFSIPKTLTDQLERVSRSYLSSLNELGDTIASNIDQTASIRKALKEVNEKVKKQKSEDESQYSFTTSTSASQNSSLSSCQIRTCITIDQMNLVLKCIETLHYLESELKKKEKEVNYLQQNAQRYLHDVHGCTARAIRIQNYVKSIPLKRAKSLQGQSKSLQKQEQMHAASDNPVSALLCIKSPNTRFYSSDLLQLESQRLIHLLNKQTISLFSLS